MNGKFFGKAARNFVLAVTVAICAPGLSFAQVNVPDAGQVNRWNQAPDATHTAPRPTTSPTEAPIVDQDGAQSQSADPSLQRKFQVVDIRLEGGSNLDSQDAEALIAQYEGKEVSFVELRQLADKLTQLYKDKGMMTSVVYVPPQRIENGVVTLKAAEGVLGEVTFQKDRWFGSRAVLPRMDADPGDVFDVDDLKRSLRRINENPDLKVRAVLVPGKEPDKTDLRLEGQDNFPLHVAPFWDNLGRELIGIQRFGVTTSLNNVTGFGDQAFNSVSLSRRSVGVVSHYELPLGEHGTRIGFDHSHSRIRLGEEFEDLKVKGRATVYSPYISQELYNSERVRLSLDVAFDWMNMRTDILGDLFSKDRLRVLRPALNLDTYDPWGRTIFRNEFGFGFDMWGATTGDEPTASREGAGSKFFRYTGSINRFQKMPWNTYAILRAVTQLTPDRLVSAQQLQMGGAFTVRGYREGVVIGDNGYNFSGEWRVPFFLFPRSWKIPKTNYTLRDNIQIVSFIDYGAVFTNDPAPGVDSSEHLLGTGIGLRARLTRFIVARVDMGIPLLRQPPDSQRPRIHFGLSSELF